MILAPLQYFGIGDVIFCMSLVRSWINEDRKVVWGVLPDFVEGLNLAYPDIKFVDYKSLPIDYNCKEEKDMNGYRLVPLRWNVELLGVPYQRCMETKYTLFDKDWKDWQQNAAFNRDEAKEEELYQLLTGGEPYVLVNRFFRSNSTGVVKVDYQGDLPIVYMERYHHYSLFDWAKVIENATEIHTVSTSVIYLLELLQLKAERICIYIRRPDENSHKNYDYILRSHNYTLMP